MESLDRLETERRCERTSDLDVLPTLDLVRTLHAESADVWRAVEAVLPALAQVVDTLAERLERGGRLFYIGAGTSGRLGVLDASECPPTFGVPKEMVQGIIAGGELALTRSIEGAEDDPAQGAREVDSRGIGPGDMVVGIAASGRTPYVVGALERARQNGAATAAVVNVSHAALSRVADVTLAAVTGPEPVTGSTRMKAGTAQKLILNLLTTACMVRMGRVYGNLMVDVQATNVKLRDRAIRIVSAATGADAATAAAAVKQAGGSAKTAIVMIAHGVDAAEAERRLRAASGWVRRALEREDVRE